jgi:hypothetical protein
MPFATLSRASRLKSVQTTSPPQDMSQPDRILL